ncbi:hypothetical protein PspLS_07021 [Pyricularia sp. CBS 133598]|nr:hypothetical protein PspLS_07021 [Pyricularia sp. CBS 133598]
MAQLLRAGQSSPPDLKTDGNGILGCLFRFWRRPHVSDYLGLALVLAGHIVVGNCVNPFQRMFFTSDLSISFPYTEHERVSVLVSVVYAMFVPIAIIILTNFLTGAPAYKHHVSLLGLAISIFLTAFLTDVVKNLAGKTRPDFLARCKPKPGTTRDELVNSTVCTETNFRLLYEGWRSFPSGHSSFSFAGLGYISLFLAGQLRAFSYGCYANHKDDDKTAATVSKRDRRGLCRPLFCMLPLLCATIIAISRVQDYRHDVYDVSTGAVLGFLIAFWSYRHYWPKLQSTRCSEPWPVSGVHSKEYETFDGDEESGVGIIAGGFTT